MKYKTYPLKSKSDEFSIAVKNINYKSSHDFTVLHRHDYFEILLFKKVDVCYQIIDFKEYKITNHSAFIIMPGQVHLIKNKPQKNGILIQFTKEFLELSIVPSVLNWFIKFQTNQELDLTESEFGKLYAYFEKLKEIYESSSHFKFQKLQKFFGLIFFELLEHVPDKSESYKKQDLSYKFMWLANENFREMRLVKKYAKLLDCNINKLEKQVKIHFGKSPLNIINELLLVEIKRLFLLSKLTHKEIAYKLNFDSQSSYSRFIKTHTQMTPTALKKSLENY